MANITTLGSASVALVGLLTLGCSSSSTTPPPAPNSNAGSSGMGTGGQAAGGGASGSGGLAAGGSSGTGGSAATAGTGGDTSVAGSAGAGTAGSGGGGPLAVPRGMSAGCGVQNGANEPGNYTRHDIDVPGVDQAYIAEHPDNQGGYDWEHRNYMIRIPSNYDPTVAYPLVFSGGGCGGDATIDDGGPSYVPDDDTVIRVGLSYMWGDGQGACFQDDGVNTPDIPYFDAAYADIIANNCVDLEKVFIGGYSSGAWMAYTTGFARGGIIRGIVPGSGGIRAERPPESPIPFAFFGIVGGMDTANPQHDTSDGTSCAGTEADGCWKGEIICGTPGGEDCVDEGSGHARDLILERNGCTGGFTGPSEQFGIWPDCLKYTTCPAHFPVVFCIPPDEGHGTGGDRFSEGAWQLMSALPPVP